MKRIFLFLTIFFIVFACEFSFTFTFSTPLRVAPKIGAIIYSKEFLPSFEGLKAGLLSLGYSGSNGVFYKEYVIDGDLGKIENIMDELKKDGFEIVFVTTTPAAKKVFSLNNKYNFQVIFNEVADPVSSGLVKNMDNPGMNLTGVSHGALRMIPKRIEILKEFLPELKKIYFITGNLGYLFPGEDNLLEEASKLENIEIETIVNISTDETLSLMAHKIESSNINSAVVLGISPELVRRFGSIKELCAKYRIPIMSMDSNLVKLGATMSYAPEFYHVGYQSAFIADMILKGAKASDVPVQMPDEIFIYLNHTAINQIDMKYDERFLSYADEVIR